ncbi:hypothetical protein T10_9297 [Trichinella papuae]|uniref:Uncharacterized protein n=1 Tax=Trichinella papuae TaxID=268474 RepID=A0A0V1MFB5_9BILA|nr:hypothetical protein T10_9297 [Trichinella papuae]
MSRMISQSPPKKLVVGKERLIDVLQEELEAGLDEEERNIAMHQWSKYRRSFREGKVKARALIHERQTVDVVPGSTRPTEFDYRSFDGDVTKFRQFWDQFESSVHQKTDLADAAKLTYLRSCVTGEVLGAIAGLAAANADYQVAVQRIKQRLDRPVIATR